MFTAVGFNASFFLIPSLQEAHLPCQIPHHHPRDKATGKTRAAVILCPSHLPIEL